MCLIILCLMRLWVMQHKMPKKAEQALATERNKANSRVSIDRSWILQPQKRILSQDFFIILITRKMAHYDDPNLERKKRLKCMKAVSCMKDKTKFNLEWCDSVVEAWCKRSQQGYKIKFRLGRRIELVSITVINNASEHPPKKKK